MSARPGFTFAMRKENGKLSLLNERRFTELVRRLPDGDYDGSVEKHVARRSLNQNAYIHAVPITILSEHLGYELTEMKYVLMGECWGWKLDALSGKEIPIKPSTSEMNVEECNHFIEWVIRWAAINHNVTIPLPNEEWSFDAA